MANHIDINEAITKVIKDQNINIDNIKQKPNLNPILWDENDTLHDDVRKTLLLNAYEFIKFLKIDNLKVKDIIVTGSNANYNWCDYSDIDIHVIIDFDQISKNKDFLSEFFKTKKSLWEEKLQATIKGHDIELYVQDINEPHSSTGTYSILNNKWISKPIKKMISIDINNVKQKFHKFVDIINEILEARDDDYLLKMLNKLKKKIKKYRESGLYNLGEYSTENLVFKLLRMYGYIDKINKIINNIKKSKLTLENE